MLLIKSKAHCLDAIRQRLMCTMDIGVFGSIWVNKTDPKPFVDFNTQHKCRNFNAIRDWAEQNQVEEHLPQDFWDWPQLNPEINVLEHAP